MKRKGRLHPGGATDPRTSEPSHVSPSCGTRVSNGAERFVRETGLVARSGYRDVNIGCAVCVFALSNANCMYENESRVVSPMHVCVCLSLSMCIYIYICTHVLVNEYTGRD